MGSCSSCCASAVVVHVVDGRSRNGTSGRNDVGEMVTLDLSPYLPEWYVPNNGAPDERAIAICKVTWKKIALGTYDRYQKERARNLVLTPFLFFLDLFFAILRDQSPQTFLLFNTPQMAPKKANTLEAFLRCLLQAHPIDRALMGPLGTGGNNPALLTHRSGNALALPGGPDDLKGPGSVQGTVMTSAVKSTVVTVYSSLGVGLPPGGANRSVEAVGPSVSAPRRVTPQMLALKHAHMGFRPENMAPFANALLMAFTVCLGSEWTAQDSQSWAIVYSTALKHMLPPVILHAERMAQRAQNGLPPGSVVGAGGSMAVPTNGPHPSGIAPGGGVSMLNSPTPALPPGVAPAPNAMGALGLTLGLQLGAGVNTGGGPTQSAATAVTHHSTVLSSAGRLSRSQSYLSMSPRRARKRDREAARAERERAERDGRDGRDGRDARNRDREPDRDDPLALIHNGSNGSNLSVNDGRGPQPNGSPRGSAKSGNNMSLRINTLTPRAPPPTEPQSSMHSLPGAPHHHLGGLVTPTHGSALGGLDVKHGSQIGPGGGGGRGGGSIGPGNANGRNGSVEDDDSGSDSDSGSSEELRRNIQCELLRARVQGKFGSKPKQMAAKLPTHAAQAHVQQQQLAQQQAQQQAHALSVALIATVLARERDARIAAYQHAVQQAGGPAAAEAGMASGLLPVILPLPTPEQAAQFAEAELLKHQHSQREQAHRLTAASPMPVLFPFGLPQGLNANGTTNAAALAGSELTPDSPPPPGGGAGAPNNTSQVNARYLFSELQIPMASSQIVAAPAPGADTNGAAPMAGSVALSQRVIFHVPLPQWPPASHQLYTPPLPQSTSQQPQVPSSAAGNGHGLALGAPGPAPTTSGANNSSSSSSSSSSSKLPRIGMASSSSHADAQIQQSLQLAQAQTAHAQQQLQLQQMQQHHGNGNGNGNGNANGNGNGVARSTHNPHNSQLPPGAGASSQPQSHQPQYAYRTAAPPYQPQQPQGFAVPLPPLPPAGMVDSNAMYLQQHQHQHQHQQHQQLSQPLQTNGFANAKVQGQAQVQAQTQPPLQLLHAGALNAHAMASLTVQQIQAMQAHAAAQAQAHLNAQTSLPPLSGATYQSWLPAGQSGGLRPGVLARGVMLHSEQSVSHSSANVGPGTVPGTVLPALTNGTHTHGSTNAAPQPLPATTVNIHHHHHHHHGVGVGVGVMSGPSTGADRYGGVPASDRERDRERDRDRERERERDRGDRERSSTRTGHSALV